MVEHPLRYRIGTSDALSFDVQAGRDNWLDVTVIEWDSELPGTNGLISTGVGAHLRHAIGSTATQIDLAVEVLDADTGQIRIKILLATLNTLVWDLGQKTQTLWLDIYAQGTLTTGAIYEYAMPVFDSLGNAAFPVRVHNSLGTPI